MSSHSNTLLKSVRHWLGAVALLGALSAVVSSVCAQDLKPEQRLEAIRAALVEAAMKSNTRVSTTSWMDTRGALLELNRFSSEIRLRDIQIGQYKKTNSADTVELSNRTLESVAAVSCTAPRARSPIRHVMRVGLDLASSIAPEHHYLAQKNRFCRQTTSLTSLIPNPTLAVDDRRGVQT